MDSRVGSQVTSTSNLLYNLLVVIVLGGINQVPNGPFDHLVKRGRLSSQLGFKLGIAAHCPARCKVL
jgi:hypothetical protein